MPIIRIAAEVMDIEVIEPRKSSTGRQIPLRAKVHVREMRQASNIKSWRPRAMCGVGKGKELVVGERVHIKLQQIVELWNCVLDVNVRPAIARIVGTGGGVAGGK